MIIGHTVKPGHKCINPLKQAPPASYIKDGERLQVGNAELFYYASRSNPSLGMYMVYDRREGNLAASKRVFYEFPNYQCALTKLAELAKLAEADELAKAKAAA